MKISYRYASVIIALVVACLADVSVGNDHSLVIYLVAVVLVSWIGGGLAGISSSVAALAVWTFINYAELAATEYPLFTLQLILKGCILLSASLLVSLVRERSGTHSDALYTDPLTGLYNMKAFSDITDREINRCSRYGHPFSIVYLDADNFSDVNTAVGHMAGDELLVCISDTLSSNVRKSDAVAHLGGDNYILLLPETGPEQARNASIKIKTKLDEAVAGKGYSITFSIGLITYLTPPASVEQVLSGSEAAMFQVKSSGKNAVHHDISGATER